MPQYPLVQDTNIYYLVDFIKSSRDEIFIEEETRYFTYNKDKNFTLEHIFICLVDLDNSIRQVYRESIDYYLAIKDRELTICPIFQTWFYNYTFKELRPLKHKIRVVAKFKKSPDFEAILGFYQNGLISTNDALERLEQ